MDVVGRHLRDTRPWTSTSAWTFISNHSSMSRPEQDWLIFRGSFSRCVGIFEDCAQATRQAIVMAEYCALCGQQAQVHEKPGTDLPWRTVWHLPDTTPRFR